MDKIKRLLSQMSLREKALQLTQLNAEILYSETTSQITGESLSANVKKEECGNVASVLNYGEGERENIQRLAMRQSAHQIPLIFMMDIIHGCRTIFPIPLAMGCTFDEALVEGCAEMSAKEAKATGIDVTFSPMVDLARDCRWGRVMETTGEDHFLNGEMGKAFIRGYHKGGIACCVKHFAAYGASEAGRDYHSTDVSDFYMQEYYLHAYRECMKEKPEMVMSSFNCLNGKPVNARKELLVDLLREEWGFDGVLISDYNAVYEMMAHGVAENEKDCAELAVRSQIDIEMISNCYISHLEELVSEGKISIEEIDRMVERVLRLKEKCGLFEKENNGFDMELYQKLYTSEEHKEIALRAAERSFVLLKNEGVLPLKKEEKVALIGPFAEEKNILGAWSFLGKVEDTQTVREGIEGFLQREIPCVKGCGFDYFDGDESQIPSAIEISEGADTVIVCFGEPSGYSGECRSRANPLPSSPQIALLKALKEKGKRVVGLLFTGRPLVLTEAEKYLDALLCVWQPGSLGAKAIANTLYGVNNPSGKLTMSFPRSVGQCPIYYNELHGGRRKQVDDMQNSYWSSAYIDERNAPLYPFGYGLSYTQFVLSDIQPSKTVFKKDEKITLSVRVQNVGTVSGREILQLYIRDKVATFARPVKELKGYQTLVLDAGEEKTVTFEVGAKQLSYHDDKGKLLLEEGAFELMIGNSSDNVFTTEVRLV